MYPSDQGTDNELDSADLSKSHIRLDPVIPFQFTSVPLKCYACLSWPVCTTELLEWCLFSTCGISPLDIDILILRPLRGEGYCSVTVPSLYQGLRRLLPLAVHLYALLYYPCANGSTYLWNSRKCWLSATVRLQTSTDFYAFVCFFASSVFIFFLQDPKIPEVSAHSASFFGIHSI